MKKLCLLSLLAGAALLFMPIVGAQAEDHKPPAHGSHEGHPPPPQGGEHGDCPPPAEGEDPSENSDCVPPEPPAGDMHGGPHGGESSDSE